MSFNYFNRYKHDRYKYSVKCDEKCVNEYVEQTTPHLDEDGVFHSESEIVCVGKKNVYERTQKIASQCNLISLIKRIQGGSGEVIPPPVSSFVDVVGMPTTLQESLNAVNKAKQIFDTLPLEVKNKYKHDLGAFLHDLDVYNKNLSVDTSNQPSNVELNPEVTE